MAGVAPFFFTGARAKIILDGKTVAFATNISYSVSVKHATPRVLGRFEAETVQPLQYDVVGSLTIIRYAQGLKDFMSGVGLGSPPIVTDDGNGVGGGKKNGLEIISRALGLPESGKLPGGSEENFIPARLFQAKMFDIEIRQQLPGNRNVAGTSVDAAVSAFFGGASREADTVPIVRLRGCRFTNLDFSLNKKGLAVQTMQFIARYADDDTYYAAKSGVGQELS